MKINIGSTNQVKIDALKEIVREYDFLKDAEVVGLNAPSEVSPQPKSLEETVRGAMNRARSAYQNCDYSVGIEGGFMEVPYTDAGHIEFQACVIHDGKNFSLGFSSGYECPLRVMRLVDNGFTLNDAAHQTGLTIDPHIGATLGFISVLTKGRLARKELTKQAIRTALIRFENSHLY